MGSAVSCTFQRALRSLILFGALTAACGTETSHPEPTPEPEGWSLVLHDLPAALLSVSGSTEQDVWAVGARLDDEALALHYDGKAWSRVLTGAESDLWWVHAFDEGPIFIGGDRGTIVRSDDEGFETMPTPDAAATIYGVWGTAP